MDQFLLLILVIIGTLTSAAGVTLFAALWANQREKDAQRLGWVAMEAVEYALLSATLTLVGMTFLQYGFHQKFFVTPARWCIMIIVGGWWISVIVSVYSPFRDAVARAVAPYHRWKQVIWPSLGVAGFFLGLSLIAPISDEVRINLLTIAALGLPLPLAPSMIHRNERLLAQHRSQCASFLVAAGMALIIGAVILGKARLLQLS